MARKTHRQFSKQEVTLEAVSQLLSLVWGVKGYMHSPVFGKLLHKTSPSGGARHPGEVYLMALRVKGLRAGFISLSSSVIIASEIISTNATREKAWLLLRPATFRQETQLLCF